MIIIVCSLIILSKGDIVECGIFKGYNIEGCMRLLNGDIVEGWYLEE